MPDRLHRPDDPEPIPPGSARTHPPPPFTEAQARDLRLRGFTVVPNVATALVRASDAARWAWVVLDRWVHDGKFPTNRQLAEACGWYTTSGVPAIGKVKRVLRELEAVPVLGLRRLITDDGRGVRRVGLEMVRPADFARFAPPKPERRGSESGPGGGTLFAGGGDRSDPGGGPDFDPTKGPLNTPLNPSLENGRVCAPPPSRCARNVPPTDGQTGERDERVGEGVAGGGPEVPDLDDESARLLARISRTLDRLARGDLTGGQVGGLARRFADDLGRLTVDDHSRGFFMLVARRVAAGQVRPEVVRAVISKTLREVTARTDGAEPLANVGAYLVATLRGVLEAEAHREVEADPGLHGTPTPRVAAPGPYDSDLWD